MILEISAFSAEKHNFGEFPSKSHFPVSQPQNDSFSIRFSGGWEKGAESEFFRFPRALKTIFRGDAEVFARKNGFYKNFQKFLENRIADLLRCCRFLAPKTSIHGSWRPGPILGPKMITRWLQNRPQESPKTLLQPGFCWMLFPDTFSLFDPLEPKKQSNLL